jgi:hypothetical protein
MLTVAPISIVLIALFGLAVIMAAVARMVVLESQGWAPVVLSDPGSYERERVAA